MSLFKRKPRADEEPPRCPSCNERVPEGADRCAMCGRDLSGVAPEAPVAPARPGPGIAD